MMRWIGTTLAATALAFASGGNAEADTIVLKSGVHIDGKVLFQDENTVRVRIGDRERSYAASTVASVDENEKTGHFDPNAAIEAAKVRLAKLERETGLTAKQRIEIESLLFTMQSTDSQIYEDAKQSILKFHRNSRPLDHYLPYVMRTVEPGLIAGALDVFGDIDTFKGARSARTHVTCPAANGRAMALAVFSKGESPERIEILARGMIDHSPEVRIAAARSLGQLTAKVATPLLIDAVGSGNPRLVAVANAALHQIWKTEFDSQVEWQTYWDGKKSTIDQPLVKIAMLPLVPPGETYYAEE